MAKEVKVENPNEFQRKDLIFEILKSQVSAGGFILYTGILEIMNDGYGFLRSIDGNFANSSNDTYVSGTQVKRLLLEMVISLLVKYVHLKIKRSIMHYLK